MRQVIALYTAVVLVLLAPVAQGQQSSAEELRDFDSFKLVQVGGSEPVDVARAADLLKDYDVIVVGE